MKDPNYWAEADSISDEICKLACQKLAKNVSPIQVLTGQLLALLALGRTATKVGLPLPTSLCIALKAAQVCLSNIASSEPTNDSQN